MIVKPTISFLHRDTDSELNVQVGAIITGVTGNINYPTPTPTLPVMTTAWKEFATAVSNAADGGRTLTAIKNDKRKALAILVRALAGYVQVACQGDLTILLSSGFPIHKPTRSPVGVAPAPGNLTVTLGARSGELDASAPPIPGAAIYNWRVTTATQPGTVVQSAQTTAASTTFGNLTPGVVYNIEANAVSTAGPSDWSNPVSQMVV
jgi:hypothetical protein